MRELRLDSRRDTLLGSGCHAGLAQCVRRCRRELRRDLALTDALTVPLFAAFRRARYADPDRANVTVERLDAIRYQTLFG